MCEPDQMNAYSLDLRLKVLDAVDRAIPRKEVGGREDLRRLDAHPGERYLRRRREGAGLDPGSSPGRTPSICASVEQRRMLWKQLEGNDDATLEDHCELWEKKRKVKVSVSTMSRAVRKLGWTFKKVTGSLRARRTKEKCLARARKALRSEEAGICG